VLEHAANMKGKMAMNPANDYCRMMVVIEIWR
jgi:hypothetical protein